LRLATVDESIGIALLPTAGEAKPVTFLQTAFTERHARFSPDGRFIAYESNESGRFEVQTFHVVLEWPAAVGRR
jgi:Tol biopolymer transport system component